MANIIPKKTHELVATFLDGNVEESRKIQLSLLNSLKHCSLK